MPEKTTEEKIGIGCGIIVGCLVLLWILGALIETYCKNVQLTGAVLGGFLGAPVGAGIAAILCQGSKGYRKRAKLGPLPTPAYLRRVESLGAVYLGEKGYPPGGCAAQASSRSRRNR